MHKIRMLPMFILRSFGHTSYDSKNRGETMMTVKRGDIYYADLRPVVGSEQGGVRPVLIVQNDIGNKFSPTVIAAAITSRTGKTPLPTTGKTPLPTHIQVDAKDSGLQKDSIVLLEQVRTLDKQRLRTRMGALNEKDMQRIDRAIFVSLGLASSADLGAAVHS